MRSVGRRVADSIMGEGFELWSMRSTEWGENLTSLIVIHVGEALTDLIGLNIIQ